MRLGALALVVLTFATAAQAQQIRGGVRVNDGDSIEIQGVPMELDGIDAPEAEQRCLKRGGRQYACGELATRALRTLIGGRRATCRLVARTDTGLARVRCTIGRQDLALEMLRLGWALAPQGAPADHAKVQAEAEAAGEGIWEGRFIPPWEWRQGTRLAEERPPAPPPAPEATPPPSRSEPAPPPAPVVPP